jgi:hypothetical protein
MTATSKVLCDACNADITEGGSMPSFRLTLSSEKLRNNTGFECAVYVLPPIDGTKHFCGKQCLTNWLSPPAKAEASQA